MTQAQAREAVMVELQKKHGFVEYDYVVADEYTIERPSGWVFFYTSRRYLETRNLGFLLVGNGPVYVSKSDGSIAFLGTAGDVERNIEEYESRMIAW